MLPFLHKLHQLRQLDDGLYQHPLNVFLKIQCQEFLPDKTLVQYKRVNGDKKSSYHRVIYADKEVIDSWMNVITLTNLDAIHDEWNQAVGPLTLADLNTELMARSLQEKSLREGTVTFHLQVEKLNRMGVNATGLVPDDRSLANITARLQAVNKYNELVIFVSEFPENARPERYANLPSLNISAGTDISNMAELDSFLTGLEFDTSLTQGDFVATLVKEQKFNFLNTGVKTVVGSGENYDKAILIYTLRGMSSEAKNLFNKTIADGGLLSDDGKGQLDLDNRSVIEKIVQFDVMGPLFIDGQIKQFQN